MKQQDAKLTKSLHEIRYMVWNSYKDIRGDKYNSKESKAVSSVVKLTYCGKRHTVLI